MSISRQQVNEILKRAETSDEVIEKIEGILKMQDELLPFRIKNYAQTAYGMVVIQNQHETKEIYERLISELKERILEQSKVIEILSQQLKSKKSTQT
jgi:intein/homing endonuclease